MVVRHANAALWELAQVDGVVARTGIHRVRCTSSWICKSEDVIVIRTHDSFDAGQGIGIGTAGDHAGSDVRDDAACCIAVGSGVTSRSTIEHIATRSASQGIVSCTAQ